ncbi:MAG TPA: hypothetical protein VGG10_20810 [Rhizomicrobium sp.]|jgi:hypothetical protein
MNAAPHGDGPDLDAWEAWTPEEASRILAGVDAPWMVVGGWAIDLYLGRETRVHEDLEIAVPRSFFPAIRAKLAGYALHAAGSGKVHRLAAEAPLPDDKHQCWVLDEAANKWRLDVMSEPGDALKWVYRRDERINAPREWMTATSASGVPYLVPEAALLFKAKSLRPKDEADFETCVPHLSGAARDWLRNALARVHPEHVWLERLG